MSPDRRSVTLGRLVKRFDGPTGRSLEIWVNRFGSGTPVPPEAVKKLNEGSKAEAFRLISGGNGRPANHCSHQDRGPKAHLYQGKLKHS